MTCTNLTVNNMTLYKPNQFLQYASCTVYNQINWLQKTKMKTTTAILALVPWLFSFNVCTTLHEQQSYDEGIVQRDKRESQNSNNYSSITDVCPSIELLRGRDGRDGSPGRDGRDGMSGSPGAQGPRGEPGPANGPPGPRGLQGQRGSTGATGRQGPPGPRSGGVVYTRWGKRTCPSVPGTRRVYEGRVGGSFYNHAGGANYLCMPLDPEYTLRFLPGVNGESYVYGTEYRNPVVGTNAHNVPCAVCLASSRETVLMIPAKTSCPNNEWTREYYGYLMSERRHSHHERSTFECVDRTQESIPGSHAYVDGAQLYHVEAHCHGMQCPPYDPQKELNCVVCTI